MDANDILNALNGVLDLGDTLDDSGIGVKAMTNGERTTRAACQMELGNFLLYIGDGGDVFTDGQADLVNLLLSEQFGQIPAWRMKSVAAALNAPDPETNATYLAFENGDEAMASQNGTVPTTQLRDLIISLYESFGGLMVALNENVLSKVRCETYINGLKSRQASTSFPASAAFIPVSTPTPEAARSADAVERDPWADTDVSSVVPASVSLTDNQKDYLKAVVYLIGKYGPMDTSSLASWMHKPTSSVSSAVSTLMRKGILDKNDNAKVVIVETGESGGLGDSLDKPILSGKKIRFGKSVTIELKNGCKCTEGKADNGKDYIEISYGSFSGTVGYCDAIFRTDIKLKPKETGLEAIHRLKVTNGGWIRWSESPETELHLQTYESPFQKPFSIVLLIQTEENRLPAVMNVNCVWYDDDEEWSLQAYNLMTEFISMVRVNGKPIPDHDLTGEQLMELLKPDFERDKGQIMLPDVSADSDSKRQNKNQSQRIKEQCEKYECMVLGTTLSQCTDKNIVEVVVPDGITQIGIDAFSGCAKLNKVILPDTLKAIQARAFLGCKALKEIDIPDGVTNLGGWAFQNCSALKRVGIPAGITVIKLQLFDSCKKLEEVAIPDGVTIIENEAFRGCVSLKEITIPDSIEIVCQGAFEGCDGLQIISLPGKDFKMDVNAVPDHVKEITRATGTGKVKKMLVTGILAENEEAETTKTKKKKESGSEKEKPVSTKTTVSKSSPKPKTVSESKSTVGVKSSGSDVKDDMGIITQVEEPDDKVKVYDARGATEIERAYASYLLDIEQLIIPEGITKIGHGAFMCAGMKSLKLPKSLRVLENSAFWMCENLETVEMQEGIEEIEFKAFGECPRLKDIYLPDSIKTIDVDAFVDDILHKDDFTHITVHMSGNLARKLESRNDDPYRPAFYAKAYAIDGKCYSSIKDYIAYAEKQRQETAERERQERVRKQAEEQKQQQRNRLSKQIHDLEKERDEAKGLFAGMKRNRLQKQIDELYDLLRRI